MISSLAEAQRQGQPSGVALGLGMAGATRGAVLPAGAPATAVMQEEMQAMMARTLQSMQDLQRANGVEPNAQLLTTIQSLSQASLNAAMQAANLQAAEQLPKSLPVIPPAPPRPPMPRKPHKVRPPPENWSPPPPLAAPTSTAPTPTRPPGSPGAAPPLPPAPAKSGADGAADEAPPPHPPPGADGPPPPLPPAHVTGLGSDTHEMLDPPPASAARGRAAGIFASSASFSCSSAT